MKIATHKYLALLCSLALIVPPLAPLAQAIVVPFGEEGETPFVVTETPSEVFASTGDYLEIATAEDFLDFAEQCRYDRYSMGKTVALVADIDLSGYEVEPVPIFCGYFEGNQYRIEGLRLRADFDHQGLFRYTTPSAQIHNLTVSGTVQPTGKANAVGGIVGNNQGLLENCHFIGNINGTESVGGIAGVNEGTGNLLACSAEGGLYGESRVGGIVGDNAGTVLRCENRALVNTILEEESLSFEDMNLDSVKARDRLADIMDIGGICGLNVGILRNCNNDAQVGYPHVGYNIGGIVGRQSGFVTDCWNTASVQGRKEVGGIVGQMEPYSIVFYAPTKLNDLDRELSGLQTLVTQWNSNTSSSSTDISEELRDLQEAIDQSREATGDLLNQSEAIFNGNIDQLNVISTSISGAIDRMVDVMEDVSDSVSYLESSLKYLRESVDFFNASLEELEGMPTEYEDITKQLKRADSFLSDASTDATAGLQHLNTALELLKTQGATAMEDIFSHITEGNRLFAQATKEVVDGTNCLRLALEEISDLLLMADAANGQLQDAFYQLGKSIDEAIMGSREILNVSQGMENVFQYLQERPEANFITTDAQYQSTKDDLDASLTRISDAVARLNTATLESILGFSGDMEAMNQQLFLILHLMVEITSDMFDPDTYLETRIDDISQEDSERQTAGKVSRCQNEGKIEGDINTGGIAGSMAVDYGFDKEDDLERQVDRTPKPTLQTRAVLRECQNTGNVLGKKDSVGGIVGKMRLGYLYDCASSGDIVSQTGNYVGGIAGYSESTIRMSLAKVNLSGGDCVGGIAGFGTVVEESYVLPNVLESKAYTGAVIGQLASKGEAKRNYFVSETLGGIDGISYQGKAEPIAYTELLAQKGSSEIFQTLQLHFVDGDTEVAVLTLCYGDRLLAEELPELPEKEGQYGIWAEVPDEPLTADCTIEARYTNYRTTLSSEEMRTETLPLLLVEGAFEDDEVLYLTELPLTEDKRMVECWQLEIPPDGNPTHTVRILPPNEKAFPQIYQQTAEGIWMPCDTTRDGPYFCFTAEGTELVFAILEVDITPIYASGVIFVFVLIVVCRHQYEAKKYR